MAELSQYAPYPSTLEALVAMARYKEGWRFYLGELERDPPETHGQAAGGLTLVITRVGPDAYHPERTMPVNHYFVVPAATWDRDGWLNWLMDCVENVELHEAREFFQITRLVKDETGEYVESTRPFSPNHGPGRDPYRRYAYASETDRRTSFRGKLND